jgi:hypothetical protein
MMSNLADQLAHMRSSSHEVGTTGLTEQLEQMRIRMNDAARRESDLASELNAAIRRMDDQLLHEVRSMAAEHEARRANILHELQSFATRLNELPHPPRQRQALGGGPRGLLPSAPPMPQHRPALEQAERQQTIEEMLTRHLSRQSA